jgi:hypothetical protein
MPIEQFAFVLTGGKTSGCVKDPDVDVGVATGIAF